jgi:MFS family permease
MTQSRTCYSLKCGYVTEEEVDNCPKCGGRMRSSRQVRVLGALQLIIGLFLIGLMGTITASVAPMLMHPGRSETGAGFTGTPEQGQLILGLFGLLLVFGFGATLSGLWQVITGRRNRWVVILMLVLFVILVLVGFALRSALKA